MIKRLLLVVSMLSMLCLPLLSMQSVAAFDPFQGTKQACSTSGADSAPCSADTGSSDPVTGSNGIIMKVTNLLAVAGGVAAVVLIMINGIRFILSGGNPDRVSSARDGVIYSLIGLIVIIVARSIIVFVINRL